MKRETLLVFIVLVLFFSLFNTNTRQDVPFNRLAQTSNPITSVDDLGITNMGGFGGANPTKKATTTSPCANFPNFSSIPLNSAINTIKTITYSLLQLYSQVKQVACSNGFSLPQIDDYLNRIGSNDINLEDAYRQVRLLSGPYDTGVAAQCFNILDKLVINGNANIERIRNILVSHRNQLLDAASLPPTQQANQQASLVQMFCQYVSNVVPVSSEASL
jgi:hypothetical protein